MKTFFENVMNGNENSVKMGVYLFAAGLVGIALLKIIGAIMDSHQNKNNITQIGFAEKHPKLNLLIGLCLIASTMAFGFVIGSYFLCGLGLVLINIFGWLKNEISKLDAVIIVALITGAVSLVGVIISSVVSKIIEFNKSKQKYLTEKREDAYENFVEMIYKVQQNAKGADTYTNEMMIEDISRFSKQITLWGSPKVVNKWVKFRENSIKQNSGQEILFIMEDIMNEMRKDLGLRKVKKGNLLAFFVDDIKDVMKKK